VTSEALRALREKFQDVGDTVSFADLSEPLLLDLALGWQQGRPFAEHAAGLLSRIDGLPEEGRAAEIAGRALLTLLARRRTGVVPATPAENVRLLGDPDVETEGDPEAREAFRRREEEYRSLSAIEATTTAAEFAIDAAGAFAAAKSRADEGRHLPSDEIGAAHRLALLGQTLPPGLRAWFHERYPDDGGAASRADSTAPSRADSTAPSRADSTAWRFVLVSRALARHREAMETSGVLQGQGTSVPQKLLDALLATDLGALARTALME
jgi:hypothetical protein